MEGFRKQKNGTILLGGGGYNRTNENQGKFGKQGKTQGKRPPESGGGERIGAMGGPKKGVMQRKRKFSRENYKVRKDKGRPRRVRRKWGGGVVVREGNSAGFVTGGRANVTGTFGYLVRDTKIACLQRDYRPSIDM